MRYVLILSFMALAYAPSSVSQVDDGQLAYKSNELMWASAEAPPTIAPWGQTQFLIYRTTWATALGEMNRFFTADAVEQNAVDTWDDQCDRVLVGLVDLQVMLQEAAPAETALSQEVIDWIVDETEAVNQLCEHGRSAATTYQAVAYVHDQVQDATDEAVAVAVALHEDVGEAVERIEALDDELGEIEAIAGRASLGRELTAVERARLEHFRESNEGDLYRVWIHLLPTHSYRLENLLAAIGNRSDTYGEFLDSIRAKEDIYDAAISELPASIEGSEGTRRMYEDYVEALKGKRDSYGETVDAYEEATLELRTGDLTALYLPMGIKDVGDLEDRVRQVQARTDKVISAAKEAL